MIQYRSLPVFPPVFYHFFSTSPGRKLALFWLPSGVHILGYSVSDLVQTFSCSVLIFPLCYVPSRLPFFPRLRLIRSVHVADSFDFPVPHQHLGFREIHRWGNRAGPVSEHLFWPAVFCIVTRDLLLPNSTSTRDLVLFVSSSSFVFLQFVWWTDTHALVDHVLSQECCIHRSRLFSS